jgi:hypothetical protein
VTGFAEVRPDFARCRVLRHAYEPAGEVEVGGVNLIAWRCTSCATLRYDRWNVRTGERWGKPTYAYPDGYQDRTEGRDNDWWRKTYAEILYQSGIIQTPPNADTRRRSRKAAG